MDPVADAAPGRRRRPGAAVLPPYAAAWRCPGVRGSPWPSRPGIRRSRRATFRRSGALEGCAHARVEGIDHPARRAAVDRGRGTLDALARLTHDTGDFQCQRGPEQQAVAMCATILAVQHGLERLRVMARIAASKVRSRAGGEPVVRRRAHLYLELAGSHVEHRERPDGRRLLPPISAVD